MLWGALAGALPDMDIIANPFLTEVQQLAAHRGITHSLLFAVVGGAAGGWLLYKLNRRAGADLRDWIWMVFLALITHALLDCFTVYGTQIFQPFSDYAVMGGSIFIIDPLYTVPLMLSMLVGLFMRRDSVKRRWVNWLGLGLSTFYLFSTWSNQRYMEGVFTQALATQQIPYEELLVVPTPFNTVLWMGVAAGEDRVWVGLYSHFDKDKRIDFKVVERNQHLIEAVLDQAPVQRLLWFSHGYYRVEQQQGKLIFNDLRFGRSDGWLGDDGKSIFSFELVEAPGDPRRIIGFNQRRPQMDGIGAALGRVWVRLKGIKKEF